MLKKDVVILALTGLVLVSFISCTNKQHPVSAKSKVSISEKYEPIKQNINNKIYTYKSKIEINAPMKQEFIVTYYTDLNSENGYGAVNCLGEKLEHTMIASNYYKLGTKIKIDGVTYEVRDRGSSRFNNPKRLDMFIPRNKGESNSEYYKRVNAMGVKRVEGHIVK